MARKRPDFVCSNFPCGGTYRRRHYAGLRTFSTRCGKAGEGAGTTNLCRWSLASDSGPRRRPGARMAFRGRACIRLIGASAHPARSCLRPVC